MISLAHAQTAGAAADPMGGLMQMLPSTFAAHALPGKTDIWNPVDNAISSIRYIASRYGAPANIPGLETQSYGGY